MFLRKHGLTRNSAVKKILTNNRGNKAKRILNSGREGGFRAGYLKNLPNNRWKSIINNLNKTNMSNNSKNVFRQAASMRSTHRVNTWGAKTLRRAGVAATVAAAAVTAVVVTARKVLPAPMKEKIISMADSKFGPEGAKYARMLLMSNSNTPPPKPKTNKEEQVQQFVKQQAEQNAKVRQAEQNAASKMIKQNYSSDMSVNNQLALGNNMARARAGNVNAKRRVNVVGHTARFQSSVAAAIVTPFAKGIIRNIAGTVSKPVINKIATLSKNQLVTTIQRQIPPRELAAIGERTATVTQRNSRSQNMIRSALNLKNKLQMGKITNLTNSQVSLLLQGIYKAPRARNLFLKG